MRSLFRKKRIKSWQRSRTFKNNKFSLRRKNDFAKISKIAIIAGAVFFAVYFLFFSQVFLIKEIKISGNRSISSENIENFARVGMSDAASGFISGNNFFFDKNEIVKSALTEEFSEIKSIEIKRIFPDALEIKIVEKEPTIIWCRFDDCYYIDNNGAVFARADNNPKLNADKRIIKIIEEKIIKEEELAKEEVEEETREEELAIGELKKEGETGNEVEIGNEVEVGNEKEIGSKDEVKNSPPDKGGLGGVVLSPIEINDKVSDGDFIDFALNIDREIKRNTQMKIKFYKTKGTNTRELIAYTDKNIRLYFNAMEDASLQVRYLKDFLLKGIGKDEVDNLEYIYLESGNRVFYK